VLTLAEADAELQRLALLKKNHLDEQYVARRKVRDLPEFIHAQNGRLARLTADEQAVKEHEGDLVSIAKHSLARDDVTAVLGKKLDALPFSVREPTRVPIGTYRGLAFGVIVHPSFPPDVYLEGELTRTSSLSKEHQGPRAVLNALERIANGYAGESVRVRQDLAIAQSQLRDYQDRLGKPFQNEAYQSELTNLRDQLKAKLSASGQKSGEESGPTASDLAERIKSLRAANTVDATPQRSERKASTAEEPISARIRRRQEEAVAFGGTPTSPDTPPGSFSERILLERNEQHDGHSLA
jgi:hypothetical protein